MRIQAFDFSVDLLQSVLWQYNDAARVEKLLTDKQAWYDANQTAFWENWVIDVFDLRTANEFGLSVWSVILDLPLFIGPKPDPADKPIFGFGTETMTPNGNQNFQHGNFSNGAYLTYLTVAEKRIILRLRYFQLISRAAIPEINRFLNYLFKDRGPAYVLDGLDMSITAVFAFPLGSRLLYILEQYDLIPRGTGVGIKYVVDPVDIFGFGSEAGTPNTNQNFENGNFIQEGG